MKKSSMVLLTLAVFALILASLAFYVFRSVPEKVAPPKPVATTQLTDATYVIDGKSVTLKNGLSETPAAADSAEKVTTRYFGNEVRADLDGDGREDAAFILTQDAGGSGTFFYVVAVLKTAAGPKGSQGFLLGDRIAPQTTELGQGNVIVVNYADRKPGESFTTPPSVGKSLWLKLNTQTMRFQDVSLGAH
jgi:hypothetical protein